MEDLSLGYLAVDHTLKRVLQDQIYSSKGSTFYSCLKAIINKFSNIFGGRVKYFKKIIASN
jgi:hypothetical protein